MKENNNNDSNSPILNIFESKKNIIQNIDEINKSYSKQLTSKNSDNIELLQFSTISYPQKDLHAIPILQTGTNEYFYLYFSKEEYDYLKIYLKHAILNSNTVIGKFSDFIFVSLNNNINVMNLERRILKSYSKEMRNIKGVFSIVIDISEKFKYKGGIKKIMEKNRDFITKIHKYLDDNFVENEKNFIEFLSLQELLYKNLLNKVGLSFLNENVSQNEILTQNDENYNLINDDVNYKKLLFKIFSERINNDFRINLIEYCINKDTNFKSNNFEKFILYFEYFVLLFSGIKIKYYIDEIGKLNLDFYADEKTYMNLAETFHYQVQFKICDMVIIKNKDGYSDRKNQITKKNFFSEKTKNLKEINKLQFNEYNENYIENYPPYTNFIKAISNRFRRYNENDDFHMCNMCEDLSSFKQCYTLKCSSCFRNIDKERLIYTMLSTLMDFDKIKNSIENNTDDYCGIINKTFLLHNYRELFFSLNLFTILKTYLNPFINKESRYINKIFRNVFGEEIGFFYEWISHYIHWLIYPSVIGIIIYFLKILFIFNMKNNLNIKSLFIFDVIFYLFIVLWGNYYLKSWKNREKMLCFMFGMENYKLERPNEILNSDSINEDLEIFLSVKIPVYDPLKSLIHKFIIFIIILISTFSTIIINIIIFIVEKKISKNYNIFPIIIYLIREISTRIFFKINEYLSTKENYTTQSEYNFSVLVKQILFEFVNYYFNLYYIAFIKKYFDTCLYNDCFIELGNQLTMIILSDFCYHIIQFSYNIIFKKKKQKKFEKDYIFNKEHKNSSRKLIYYTRNEFKIQDLDNLLLEIILNFGYVIQFGITSSLSFFLIFFLTILIRILNTISFKYFVFYQSFKESKGIGIFVNVQTFFQFLGIISNICILLFSNNMYNNYFDIKEKLFIMIIIENFVFLVINIIIYGYLPNWFQYRHQVDVKYYKKFGVRKKNI